jgi:hypothetical protein|tara:strand:- start:1470 stop:1712 length:243 start_codon:yes stop_codon:yes gene_type:complete
MKTIAHFGTLMEAELLKLKLASFGIDAFIPDELTAGVAPHIFATRSGIRLQVEEKDVESAKAAMLSEVDPLADDFSTEGE